MTRKATPAPARQVKTPRQRAQEALDVEERRVKRLTEKRDTLQAELDEISQERDQAVVRRDYLAGHPDLGDPQQMSLLDGGDDES